MNIEIPDKELLEYHAEFNQLYGYLLGKFALDGRDSDVLDNQFSLFNKVRESVNAEVKKLEVNQKK